MRSYKNLIKFAGKRRFLKGRPTELNLEGLVGVNQAKSNGKDFLDRENRYSNIQRHC